MQKSIYIILSNNKHFLFNFSNASWYKVFRACERILIGLKCCTLFYMSNTHLRVTTHNAFQFKKISHFHAWLHFVKERKWAVTKMSTQLSPLKLSLSWSIFTLSALLCVHFSNSIKIQPWLIFRIQKRLPLSHSEENDQHGGWLEFWSSIMKTCVPIPSAVLCIPPWNHSVALLFSGKCSHDLNPQTREFSSNEKVPVRSLGRLHLRLIGEWERDGS